MSGAALLQAGFLLHYRQYGDTNFIVDFFSLDHGRVSMIAKGARSAKPRTRALYQPFQPLLMSWFGEHELRTLTGIEESGHAIKLDGPALPCGYYLNEIILRLLAKDQPFPELFAHYSLALAQLSDPEQAPEPVLRQFELLLLEALGLLPNFEQCRNDGEPILDEENYLFYTGSNQAILVPEADQHMAIPKKKIPDAVYHADGETVDVGIPVSGQTLNRLAAFDIDHKDTLKELKPLMRRLLQVHLGDRPLNSRELFSSMTPPPPPPPAMSTSVKTSESTASQSETQSSETSSSETSQPETSPPTKPTSVTE